MSCHGSVLFYNSVGSDGAANSAHAVRFDGDLSTLLVYNVVKTVPDMTFGLL